MLPANTLSTRPLTSPPFLLVKGMSTPFTAGEQLVRKRVNILLFGAAGGWQSPSQSRHLGWHSCGNGYRVLFPRTTDWSKSFNRPAEISRWKALWPTRQFDLLNLDDIAT